MAPQRRNTVDSAKVRALIRRTDRLFDQAEKLQRKARRELADHFGPKDRPTADDSARRDRIAAGARKR